MRRIITRYLMVLILCMGISGTGINATCSQHRQHESITYVTHDKVEIEVTNKNVMTFLGAVRVANSGYTSTERGVAVYLVNKRDRINADGGNGALVAGIERNRILPLDSAVVKSFEALMHNTSLALKVNEGLEQGGSVPQVLLSQAGDVLANIQRMVSLAEELGVKLPPGVIDAMNIMERIAH